MCVHVCLCAYDKVTPYDTCCLLHASLQTIDMCDYTTTRSFVKRTGKVCGEVGGCESARCALGTTCHNVEGK